MCGFAVTLIKCPKNNRCEIWRLHTLYWFHSCLFPWRMVMCYPCWKSQNFHWPVYLPAIWRWRKVKRQHHGSFLFEVYSLFHCYTCIYLFIVSYKETTKESDREREREEVAFLLLVLKIIAITIIIIVRKTKGKRNKWKCSQVHDYNYPWYLENGIELSPLLFKFVHSYRVS